MTTARSLLPDPLPEPDPVQAATVSRAVPPMVTLDSYGPTHEWGPVTWMTPATPPVRGARALVLIDNTGALWAFGAAA